MVERVFAFSSGNDGAGGRFGVGLLFHPATTEREAGSGRVLFVLLLEKQETRRQNVANLFCSFFWKK